MPSTSATVNKALRAHVAPLLRRAGFERVDARNAWSWRHNCVLVFNIRAVGNYFAGVTGWSPASVAVSLGVFFKFAAPLDTVKTTPDGRPLPAEYQCHMRSHLERTLDQPERLIHLSNPAEKRRRDLWWVDPTSGNAEEVAIDIARQLESAGLTWYDENSTLDRALRIVESERDCFNKFVMAAYLAKQLGAADTYAFYRRRSEDEGERIGIKPDTRYWFRLAGR